MIMEGPFKVLPKMYVFLYSKVHHIGHLFFYRVLKQEVGNKKLEQIMFNY